MLTDDENRAYSYYMYKLTIEPAKEMKNGVGSVITRKIYIKCKLVFSQYIKMCIEIKMSSVIVVIMVSRAKKMNLLQEQLNTEVSLRSGIHL